MHFKLLGIATQTLERVNIDTMTRSVREGDNTRIHFDQGISVVYKIQFGIFNAMCDRFLGPSIHEQMLETQE